MLRLLFERSMALFVAVVLLGGCTAPVEDIANSEECIIAPPKQPVACTMQYDPVCGCDGKTYGNACSARAAGVSSSTPGACEENNTID